MSLSQYCTEFWKLDPLQQQNIISVANSNSNNSDNDNDNEEDDDDADNDSTIPHIQYHDIARAGNFYWETLTPNMITS